MPSLLPRSRLSVLTLLVVLVPAPVRAEEGMWLPNDFPADRFRAAYGEPLGTAELEHLRLAAAKMGGGGSGSFVSPEGLVLTNHHVGADCIGKLSSAERDLMANGFVAARREDELACPDLEVLQLLAIERVTPRVRAAEARSAGAGAEGAQAATQGAASRNGAAAEASRARRAEIAAIEQECAQPPAVRCEVETLFGGAEYDLYRYRRYADVRLAFAPEAALAQFGGDPDNFDYPRFAIDFALFRAYQDGKPAATPHFLAWSPTGAVEGEVVIAAGHPGTTRRGDTMAQLTLMRDHLFPAQQALRDQQRERLEAFAARGAEQARIALDRLRGVTNSLKAMAGFTAGLLDPELMAAKRKAETELKAKVEADPALKAKYGDPWAEIATAVGLYRTFEPRYRLLETELPQVGRYLQHARWLVRLAGESERPEGERMADYRDSARASLEQKIFSRAPIYPDFEQAQLAAYLWRLRSQLGVTHPLVLATLGRERPEDLAARWVAATRLGDVEARRRLAAGGKAAIAASEDPLLRFVAAVEPTARELRRRFDDEIESVEVAAGTRISAARFELGGKESYPDATGSLRFTFGKPLAYEEGGQPVPWHTTFAGMFERSAARQNRDPWEITPALAAARDELELAGPVNFVATLDTTGGNSGSPIVDRKLHLVGLVFDGNLWGLANTFQYSEGRGRTIAVDARAMEQMLRRVYPAAHLADEIRSGATRQE